MNAKVTYVQTHIIRHTAKINKQTNKLEITKAQVESGRKRRLQDTIQTIIKTKYASSLARCRGGSMGNWTECEKCVFLLSTVQFDVPYRLKMNGK